MGGDDVAWGLQTAATKARVSERGRESGVGEGGGYESWEEVVRVVARREEDEEVAEGA